MRKKIFLSFFFLLLFGLFGAFFLLPENKSRFISLLPDNYTEESKPLEKYYFENLRRRQFRNGEIKTEVIIKEEKDYTSWLFSFPSEGKKITGMMNLPKSAPPPPLSFSQYPTIIMLRGYADEKIYFTGLGTRRAAGVFSRNGFITLAPDFLGFGGSDMASPDIIETRLEKPVTVLSLIGIVTRYYLENGVQPIDPKHQNRLFLWGHSNGGQIGLSVLEITRQPIPSVFWAPVAQGFPQSVLQFVGELDDKGSKVQMAIGEFSRKYETTKVSIDNYFPDIIAPLQVHQGGEDPLVKEEWTDNFIAKMKALGKEITYYKYPRADHNLEPDWETVVARDLDFFRKYL